MPAKSWSTINFHFIKLLSQIDLKSTQHPLFTHFKLWLWCVLVTGTPVQFHFFVSRSLAATLANTAESRLLIGRSSQQRTWTANQSAPFIWLSTFCPEEEADQACGKTILNTYIWWFMVNCTQENLIILGDTAFARFTIAVYFAWHCDHHMAKGGQIKCTWIYRFLAT